MAAKNIVLHDYEEGKAMEDDKVAYVQKGGNSKSIHL